MLDEFRRHAAEQEAVEGVEALTAHHQESVPCGRAFQDDRCDRPSLLGAPLPLPLSFNARQLLSGFLESFGRARFHALDFFLDGTARCLPCDRSCHAERRAERAEVQHVQRHHRYRLRRTAAWPTQFSPHRPYFDPSVAASTFMSAIPVA